MNTGSVFWLEQALSEEPDQACPPLTGRLKVDICIVGGGYTGLWAALEIRERAPDVSVAIVEAQECGFGASGRNGGWVTSWMDELDVLVQRFGERQALWLADKSSAAITRIRDFIAENDIDAHFRQEGTLCIGSTETQVDSIRASAEECRRLERGHLVEDVSAEVVREMTGTEIAIVGLMVHDSASVQPALLARGLRRAALRQGVRIFEGSPVIRLGRERTPSVVTPAGRIDAAHVVIATNAWAAEVRELRRSVFLVGSHIVLTEPISNHLQGLCWARGGLLGDAQIFVHYAQVTTDQRIAFGRGGGAVGPLGRVVPKHFYDPRAVAEVAADFYRWFPHLRDVRLTHAWGGAVDRAPGHLPFVGTLGEHGNLHYGLGYSGNGVGPSALIGRVLGRRVLGVEDEYTTCALVSGPPGYLPPEPFRSLGGILVREAVHRTERS